MLRNHRDYRRNNKANLAVKGAIFAKLNRSSIDNMKEVLGNDSITSSISSAAMEKLLKMVEIAAISNENMINCMLLSQSAISMSTCEEYAMQQYNSIKRGCIYEEDSSTIPNISDYIVTDVMISMAKHIFVGENQSGKKQMASHNIIVFIFHHQNILKQNVSFIFIIV